MCRYLLLSALAASLAPAAALAPGQTIDLFNGKDLEGFYTFLRTKGVNYDPDHVFRVRDGVIHISGSEFGYIATKKEYENYKLTVEFKWGELTHSPRDGKARDSGVLYHFVGPDMVWPRSIEFQIIEGGTGDIILVGDATLTVKGQTRSKGRFDRFGKGPWQDIAGYRDPVHEVEKPHGEWNLLELTADGDQVRYVVNGTLVNEGSGASPHRGKILFQSEGAEVYFRNIRLQSLR
jgi:hypothetical protein